MNSLSSQYTSDSSELVKVVLGTTGEVRLQYLSKQTSIQQIVRHWQQLTYHFIEILPKQNKKKKRQLVSCPGELIRNLSEMAINVSANCKDTPPGRWPWMESRNLLNVNSYAGIKKILWTQTLHFPARFKG